MKGPRIYKAINAVTTELSKIGLPKTRTNAQEQYQYRSIDDVLNRLAPLLAKHRLCVLPRVLERTAIDRAGTGNDLLVSVVLRVAFDLVSAVDETRHTVEAYGEALDGGDKATSKAMSSAYKAAMLQTFCVPVAGSEDADAHTHKLCKNFHEPPPVQGWEQWTSDITEMIGGCESAEALTRVQETNRALLKAISRERADLYQGIGEAFQSRRTLLDANQSAGTKASGASSTRSRQGASAPPLETIHA